jgi:uncharacterized membrane protein
VNQLLIAIYPDEARAYEALRALEDPGDPAHLGVRGLAVIIKRSDGTLSEEKWSTRLPFRAPIGALVGALIGLAAGPVGSAIGLAAGGLIGLSRDLADFGIEESFLNDVAAQLTPGRTALVIEVEKDAGARVEARLRELGADVLRTDLKAEGKPADAK